MERIRMCLLDPDLAKINTEKSHINKHKIYYFPCRLFFFLGQFFTQWIRIRFCILIRICWEADADPGPMDPHYNVC